MDFKNVIDKYIGILFNLKKKEGNPTICDNTDKPVGHYTKWNKSVTEE